MPIRITGMNSGLDTESIITALTQSKQTRLDNAKGDQKKLTWKQDKWKELNKKVVNFYNGALSNMRFSTAYTKKTTSVSNENAVSVVTGGNAMNATQNLDIKRLAKSAYLTGQEAKAGDAKATKATTVSELNGFTAGDLELNIGGKTAKITVGENDTIEDVLNNIKNAKLYDGDTQTSEKVSDKLDINFDDKNGRFFVSAKEAGESSDFSFSGDPAAALGLVVKDDGSNYIGGTSARIILNGEEYLSDSNTFEINGLTITAKKVEDGITLSTKQDTSGIYDSIKGLIKEYNDLMKEFSTLYNADKATKYKMLTDDEKDAMSDKEVEAWEDKIKDGLLSKDETIGNLRTAMRTIMSSSFEVTLGNGEKKSLNLASFGITTGDYFSTSENDRDILHIDGDPDDSSTSGNTDLLKAFISSDPTAVQNFFTELSKNLYSKLSDLMKGTEYSSSFTIYEDKLMASQYSAYNTKISDAQSALEAAQDKLYTKFSRMETALSKSNSTSGSLSGFFGGGNN
ncbi:MAG: flagellar filament capping protein FliD [Butyrivibrio sp.]|nr:flagellar filament capping protein FliD [Butyrivibrio sp.]